MKNSFFAIAIILLTISNTHSAATRTLARPLPTQNVKNYIGTDGLAAWIKAWLSVLSREAYTARVKDDNLTAEIEGLQGSNTLLVSEMQQLQRANIDFSKTLHDVQQKVDKGTQTDAAIQAENVDLKNQVATLKQQLQQLKDSQERGMTSLTKAITNLVQAVAKLSMSRG
ncbi:uncharacterized protein LOC106155890 [Lingula anatina]|uniref:Uncharacterized protein LOC106155890 n=1 Tax=Lingula anatina TaxID=7574 RepID=A0A1S3HJS0_LINAN|nr:uncharacterized protein LOC106155890 [Lingula anatina]|eukprot:XP_013386370.1 uncharacterized protein LOC106155890 [Lingula anatina]